MFLLKNNHRNNIVKKTRLLFTLLLESWNPWNQAVYQHKNISSIDIESKGNFNIFKIEDEYPFLIAKNKTRKIKWIMFSNNENKHKSARSIFIDITTVFNIIIIIIIIHYCHYCIMHRIPIHSQIPLHTQILHWIPPLRFSPFLL